MNLPRLKVRKGVIKLIKVPKCPILCSSGYSKRVLETFIISSKGACVLLTNQQTSKVWLEK